MPNDDRVHIEASNPEWAMRQAIFSERDMEVGERLSKVEATMDTSERVTRIETICENLNNLDLVGLHSDIKWIGRIIKILIIPIVLVLLKYFSPDIINFLGIETGIENNTSASPQDTNNPPTQ